MEGIVDGNGTFRRQRHALSADRLPLMRATEPKAVCRRLSPFPAQTHDCGAEFRKAPAGMRGGREHVWKRGWMFGECGLDLAKTRLKFGGFHFVGLG